MRASARHAPPTGIERLAAGLAQAAASADRAGRSRLGDALFVLGELDQAQRTDRQGDAARRSRPRPRHRHQLDAAAAEIARPRRRRRECRRARPRPKSGLPRRRRARARARRSGARSRRRSRAPSLGVAHRRGRQHVEAATPSGARQARRSAADCRCASSTPSGLSRPVSSRPRPRPHSTFSLSSMRGARPSRSIDDEAQRIRADIDDGDASRPPLAMRAVRRRRIRAHPLAQRATRRGGGRARWRALPRPERLGLVMK